MFCVSTKIYCLLRSQVAGLDAGGPLTQPSLYVLYSAGAHPPGTGKTLCRSLIAELQVGLNEK